MHQAALSALFALLMSLGVLAQSSAQSLTPNQQKARDILEPKQESGATDGIFLRAAGIPTYGVNNTFIKDSDDFSHGLNERLPTKSFYDGLEYWHALLTDLAGTRH